MNHMDTNQNKPKLVFFAYKYDEHLPEFLLLHKREHVKCLSEFFDVTVIDYDCDYQQTCDKYHPDLAFFESAWNVPFVYCRRPQVTNVRTCSKIPKLGFLYSDSFSQGRAGFLSDMDHWGIETFFSNATTAGEHVPEISNSLFIWPNFADAETFRDYGEKKSIPVLFAGNKNSLYPWRKKILNIVSKHYPSLICPHPGFVPPETIIHAVAGEPYARMLNASWFVPACGTVAKEAVRKHFEVPACKACLITERSAALEAAGFVDMKNCVFGEEAHVLDKLNYLFKNPCELESILSAGHQLAHTRHTLKHRDQIFQWYQLHRSLKSDEKIIQPGPFEPLRAVPTSSGAGNSHVVCAGSDLALLRKGDEELSKGNYVSAETLFLKCLNYVPWMPEPQFRLALCNLYNGDAKSAHEWLIKPIHFTLLDYKAIDPDPVEWAYFVISLLCFGQLSKAAERASEFPWLHHPELDRIRWVTDALKLRGCALPVPREDESAYRVSLHQLPKRNFEEWLRQLCLMLRACGQTDLAGRVAALLGSGSLPIRELESGADTNAEPRNLKTSLDKNVSGTRDASFLGNSAVAHFRRQRFYDEKRCKVRLLIKRVLQGLETKCGNFLPYHLSRRRDDEFACAVQDLTANEDVKTVLVIGAAPTAVTTESVLAGAQQNSNKPSVVCVSAAGHPPVPSQSRARWYCLPSSSPGNVSEELENIVERAKEENKVSLFDLVLIDSAQLGRQFAAGTLRRELSQAGLVILNGINSTYNHENCEALLSNPDYALVDHDASARIGYAIFQKQSPAGREISAASVCTASLSGA
jgi:hypothetical protein